ncbi:hydrogenase subunit MbhD domain-containing protein [Thermococcus sp.]|uniref:hydrogenase subunit MbhD domain-containing protein n=1 Tax=Thermococcus sp. TaxID=35749 RepID=UPI002633DEEB|nr:hydrogenase subunit MbhD domain-containing protein [Thermococcus sp.]
MNALTIDMTIQAIILIGVLITAYLTIRFRDLLAAALMSAAMSLLLSLEFYMLHAPDVAIAEAAVGAGVVTAVVVYGIAKTERWEVEP